MITFHRGWVVTGLCAVGLTVSVCRRPAQAQTVFTWTDEGGTVHFSDSPPPAGQKYEQRDVGGGPAVKGQAPLPEANAPVTDGTTNATPGEASGPARVVITSKEAIPRGPESRHVSGAVRNVGGRPADRVAVTLRVVDASGEECTSEDVNVEPTTLNAGETGRFDTTVNSPCLIDGGTVDVDVRSD
ncbi:MAG TPA: DUF4124 domain-containing protein [Candidatus Binatia bacterium]|nr:DUF4124 domain-containing protein [Candidatus Binatia bacterium]